MSYGQWKIDEKLTFDEFGYYSNELSKGSKKPVKCICEFCGIISNKRYRESTRKHICKSIINGKKRCFKCKEFKQVDDFSKNRSTFDGYQKVCKDCFSSYEVVKNGIIKKHNLLKTDLKVYLRNATSGIERKCKVKNLNFDLDKEYLFNLYQKQNGKCYYTGLEIKHNIGCFQYDSITVERLDPDKGYTKNNIVLSCFAINSFKGMMNEIEYKELLEKIIPKLIEYKNNK